jgi:hypothetical protein
MPGGQRNDRGLHTWPERAAADRVGQPGAGPRATVPTAELMRAIFGSGRANRRQLGDLVATEPRGRATLP